MSKIIQSFKMALSAIMNNKMRSFLTMLGIIIGVVSVTGLVSVVQSATGTIRFRGEPWQQPADVSNHFGSKGVPVAG